MHWIPRNLMCSAIEGFGLSFAMTGWSVSHVPAFIIGILTIAFTYADGKFGWSR